MLRTIRAHHLTIALVGAIVLVAITSALANAGGSVPAAPANLEARVVQDALKITLFWNDNSEDEEQFILERSSASSEGPWGVAALLPADSTEYNDGGLSDGVTYWYRVAATNAAGTSEYSNVASGTASELPAPQPGDADCNGVVDSRDALLVLQFDAGLIDKLTYTCLLVADVNSSGHVNALDAALILQFVAGLINDFFPAISGIYGLVTIGPMCPVIQKGVPCPDQPFSAKIAIENRVARRGVIVFSNGRGEFEISLPAGSYVIVPHSPNPGAPPFASEQPVIVTDGAFTEVLIRYDSGIR